MRAKQWAKSILKERSAKPFVTGIMQRAEGQIHRRAPNIDPFMVANRHEDEAKALEVKHVVKGTNRKRKAAEVQGKSFLDDN